MLNITDVKKILSESETKQKIVLPEGRNEKIITAANEIAEKGYGIPAVVYKTKADVVANLNELCEVYIIDEYDTDTLAQELFDLRKGKVSLEDAKKLVSEPNYFGTMLLKRGDVDCMLCGIDYTTADTLRPALQIIKTKPDTKIASSIILMNRGDETYFFSDCSLNVDPTSEQLADIAKSCANFCKQMGLTDPQVAMLCYSTNGSGMGPTVDRVSAACKILADEKVDFVFDGEIQFDSAFVKSVREKKYKDSKITKDSADVYVFPDLASGNIGYKIAQRLGNFDSVGPFILGLQKPVNDLSRGATLDDVVLSAIYTLFQSLS